MFKIQLTIINSGEANIDMREATLIYPTKNCRRGGSKSLMLTNTMILNRPRTATNNAEIFTCMRMSWANTKKSYYSTVKRQMHDIKFMTIYNLYLIGSLSIRNEDNNVH